MSPFPARRLLTLTVTSSGAFSCAGTMRRMPDSFLHRPLSPLRLIAAGMLGTLLAVFCGYLIIDFFSFAPDWPLGGIVPGLVFAFVYGLPVFGLLAFLSYWYSRNSD